MGRRTAAVWGLSLLIATEAHAGPADVLLGTSAVAPDDVVACGSVDAALADPRVRNLVGDGGTGSMLDAAADGPLGSDATLAVAQWSDGSHRIDIGFDGTKADAERWMSTLSGVTWASSDSWNIVRGGEVIDVFLEGAVLSFSDRKAESARRVSLTGPASLAGDEGCLAVAPLLRTPKPHEQPVAGAIGTPGPPGRARVRTLRSGDALADGGAVPFSATSSLQPDMVLTLAAPWSEIASDIWPAGAPLWTRLPKGLASPAGTTVAVYGQDHIAALVVAIPLRNGDGEPLASQRIRKALKAVSHAGVVQAEAGGVFAVRGIRKSTWIAPVDGGVVIGTVRNVLVDAAAGEGTPWVDKGLAEAALQNPVAARVWHDDGDVLVSARAHTGAWELQVAEPEYTRIAVERMTDLLMRSAGEALAIR